MVRHNRRSGHRRIGVLLAAFVTLASGREARAGCEADGSGERPLPSVPVTTNSRAVSGCASLGEASLSGDDPLALLRQEAFRRGADVVFLTSLAGRQVQGKLYLCGRTAIPAAPTQSTPPEDARDFARPRPAAVPSPAVPAPGMVPTPAGTTRPPSSESTPARALASPTPSAANAAASARRSSAGDRQRRAQEEFLEVQAAVRVTDDPKLVEGCEKRGAGHGEGGDALSSLRGDAVGQLANVILVRPTAGETTADFFRCPARTLQAIPLAPSPAPSPAPR